jgi:hypothetical protein
VRGPGTADNDIAHLLMGVAMAAMLAPSVTTLTPGLWEVIFGALTAWFAWHTAHGIRENGARSAIRGHCAGHLFHCAAMVYLFAAVTTSGRMEVSARPVPAWPGAPCRR